MYTGTRRWSRFCGKILYIEIEAGKVDLVQAIERGEGSGSDWAEFQQRLKQAESDACTFDAAKRQALEAKRASLCTSNHLMLSKRLSINCLNSAKGS